MTDTLELKAELRELKRLRALEKDHEGLDWEYQGGEGMKPREELLAFWAKRDEAALKPVDPRMTPPFEGPIIGFNKELLYQPREIDCEEPPPYVSADYVDGWADGCRETRERDQQEMNALALAGFILGVVVMSVLWGVVR